MPVSIDFLTANGQGQGELAARIANEGSLNVNAMRPYRDPKTGRSYITVFKGGDPKKPENYAAVPITANATLRRDEWVTLDTAVLKVAEQRLRGVADLKNAGLTYNLGNGMASTVLEYHDISDAMEAQMSMDGVSRGNNDRPNYETNYMPLPIIHADYQLNERVLQASRRLGNPLDTTLAERAARRVAEAMENMLFTNTTYTYGGGTIYSYINHPDRNTVTLGTAWDASGKTAAGIKDDVMEMKQTSIDAMHYGPWVLYIPTNYETILDEDYDTSGASTQTIKQRLLKISGITDVRVSDKLPKDNIVLVEMTSEVVRWVTGMNIQNVMWSSEGNMVHNYKVMTIQVPQIRSDQEGNSGIVHMS
jgi:uncharacterized linocin/CFP29 family protein